MRRICTIDVDFHNFCFPVGLRATAITEPPISLHKLHCCGSRIRQLQVCPQCGEIDAGTLRQGVQTSAGGVEFITNGDVEACKPASAKTLLIESFVAPEDLSGVRSSGVFFLDPLEEDQRGYRLLSDSLRELDARAVTRITLPSGRREQLAIISPCAELLLLTTLFYAHELQTAPGLIIDPSEREELKESVNFVARRIRPFDHARYTDRYREKLTSMLDARAAGAAARVRPVAA